MHLLEAMDFNPTMGKVEDEGSGHFHMGANDGHCQRVVISGASSHRISLGHCEYTDWFDHQISMLSTVDTGAVAVVDEVGVLRVQLEADVIVTVRLTSDEVDDASHADTSLEYLQAIWVVDVGVRVRRGNASACRWAGGNHAWTRGRSAMATTHYKEGGDDSPPSTQPPAPGSPSLCQIGASCQLLGGDRSADDREHATTAHCGGEDAIPLLDLGPRDQVAGQ